MTARPTTGIFAYGQFDQASDSDVMRRVIERYLRRTDQPETRVASCEVTFARRGEIRSAFQYQTTLVQPGVNARSSQIVTGIYFAGARTRDNWEEIAGTLECAESLDSPLVAAAYVPELDLLLQTFPFDRRLPALRAFMTDTEPTPALAAIIKERLGTGDWQIDRWETELIRYRVDLRACVQAIVNAHNIETGERVTRSYFAKFYATPEEWQRAHTVNDELAHVIDRSHGSLALAATVASFASERVLIQEAVTSPSLYDTLRGGGDVVDAVRRVARAIAELHCLDMQAPQHRLEMERAGADRVHSMVERISTARPELASEVEAIEALIAARLKALGEPGATPVHGDLKPAHLILDNQQVVLLDLDKFAAGEPMLDVTNILLKLRRGDDDTPKKDRSGDLTRAFLDEYFDHVPASWQKRLIPHYASGILGEAAAISRASVRPRRATKQGGKGHKVGALLDEARMILMQDAVVA